MADVADQRPENPPLWAALRADVCELARVKGVAVATRHGAEPSPAVGGLADIVTLPGFWCVLLWRLGNSWHHRGLRPLSRLAYFANLVLFGADLPAGGVVGPGMVIPHPVGVACASDVVFGARCRLMGMVRIGGAGKPGRDGHPVIGDDVWLLDGAKVFGPVRIGDRTVLAASTTLSQDVPADMYVSRPAPPLRTRPREPSPPPAADSVEVRPRTDADVRGVGR